MFDKAKIKKLEKFKLPSNKKFGIFFSAIFFSFGAYFFYKGNIATTYAFLLLSAAFSVLALFKADSLLPLNRLWMQFGLLLGMIVRPVLLGIIFFGLFTPIGILMRLFGRDELRLKLKEKPSNWIVREPSLIKNDAFKYQF